MQWVCSAHRHQCGCGGQKRTCRRQLSPPVWVLEIIFRSSGVTASTFTHWASLPVLGGHCLEFLACRTGKGSYWQPYQLISELYNEHTGTFQPLKSEDLGEVCVCVDGDEQGLRLWLLFVSSLDGLLGLA